MGSLCKKTWYWLILPKYGNSAPGTQKWNFSKFFHFCGKISRFRFQGTLNHPQTLTLSQIIKENVILAYYAQIWKFGPRFPKMEFFRIFSFLWKGLQISLLTSPQPPQTLSLSQVMQENVIMPKYGNSAPGSQKWNFSEKVYFFEKVSRFRFQRTLNHLQILMIDGDKKVVSKQPFASFPKVNSLQSWEYYAKIALILPLEMNYSIVINKCF